MTTSLWVGERVRLRGIEPADWERFQLFSEDTDLQRDVDIVYPPRSAAGSRRWAEEEAIRQPEEDRFQLAIEALDGRQLVGALSTTETSRRAGRFSFGIGLGREFHRRGYATDAIRILLRFMFRERRYHKAEVGIYASNQASIALHERLGFQHEGRLRDHEFLDGRYEDMVLMGLTDAEFTSAAANRR